MANCIFDTVPGFVPALLFGVFFVIIAYILAKIFCYKPEPEVVGPLPWIRVPSYSGPIEYRIEYDS